MPRITVKKSQISYFCFSLYAKKCFKAPVALGSENLDPPKSMGVLLLNSLQPGFHLSFRLWEFSRQQKWRHLALDLWNTSSHVRLLDYCWFMLTKTGSDLSAESLLIAVIWAKPNLCSLLGTWVLQNGSEQLWFPVKCIDMKTDITWQHW